MAGWPPVDWASRFLDDTEAQCSRECLLVDLVKALRIIGAMTPETRDLWTQFSVTCDPLTQPSRAASMVRSFLDAVISQLPSEGLAEPPRYHLDDDEARIRASRRAWADGVLEAVLGMRQFAAQSGRAAPLPSVGGTDASLGTRDGTDEVEGTLTPVDEAVHPVPEVVLEPTVPNAVASDDGPTEVVEEAANVVPVELVDPAQRGEVAAVERVFPPGGISLKLIAKTASRRSAMDGKCLAEIAEMAMNDQSFSLRQLSGARKRELDVNNPPCEGTLRICRQLVRDNFAKLGLLSGPVMRVDTRVVVGRIDVGACPVLVGLGMTGYEVLAQIVLFLASGFGIPPLPYRIMVGEGSTGVAIDLSAPAVDGLSTTEVNVVHCNPPVHVRSPAVDSDPQSVVEVASYVVGGEGSTSQGSHGGEVGVGMPLEPWNGPLRAGDLAAFTPQGQQAIYNLQSFFGQVTSAVFHVKLPDDRDLVFDSADVDGSIAILVHRVALEMKQTVSMFGSASHNGWHLKIKDSIQAEGSTIFLMSFTFLQPGAVVEPYQPKKHRRRSPSPGSKPSGSRPVFSSRALGGDRREKSKRTHSGSQRDVRDGGSSKKRTCEGDASNNMQVVVLPEKAGIVEAVEVDMHRFENDGTHCFENEKNSYGGHGVGKPLCMDCISPTLAFEVEPPTLQGDREMRGERVKLYMIYPIVKACVETDTSLALANRVIGKDDMWVAVPESYIGEFPQGFEVRVDQPDFPLPRVGPLFLPQELGQLYGLWTKWITGTSGSGLGHFRFVLVEGILCGQGLFWKVRFHHVYQGENVGFVLFHSSFQQWLSFEIGQEFSALFCGVVAVFGGQPVVGVGTFGPSRALIRRWSKDEKSGPFTLLELYAGIGGWSTGFGQIADAVVVSVEWDRSRAVALAASHNVPCLYIDEVTPEHVGTSFVLVADVTDLSWLHVTLACPFRFVCWSSPCISWSLGGKGLGLNCPEGLLMCSTIGLISFLGPEAELGENVAAVLKHDHWKLVQAFAVLTEAGGYQTVVSRLSRLVPMVRDRLILFRGARGLVLPELKLVIDPSFWMLRCEDIRRFCLIEEVDRSIFADRSFLPASLLCKAPSYLSPREVLQLRVLDARALPTLVASYRFQTSLDPRHLRLKGVFTWLLDSQDGPRFADAFEMAWIMGFNGGLCLPSDEATAMHCVGNSIAPAQALQVFWAVFDALGLSCSGPSFHAALGRLVLGKPPLHRFARHVVGSLWTLSLVDCPPPCTFAGFGLFVGGKVFFLDGQLPVDQAARLQHFSAALRLPEWWIPVRWSPILSDDFLQLSGTLRPVQMTFANVLLKFCPTDLVWRLVQLLDGLGVPNVLAMLNYRMPIGYCGHHLLRFEAEVPVTQDITLIIGSQQRRVDFVSGETLREAVKRAFPMGIAMHIAEAFSCATGESVDVDCPIGTGRLFQVWLHFKQYRVEPFGFLYLDPMMSIQEVRHFLALRFFAGRVAVFLRAMGLSVADDQILAWADLLGPLRAHMFPLKGGGLMTVSAAEELLQEQLVAHGAMLASAKTTATAFVETVGLAAVKKALEAKDTWVQLKHLATQHSIVLVKFNERAADPLQVVDPWAKYSKSRQRGPKAADKQAEVVRLTVDYTFFHSKGLEVPPITVDQLFQGFPGVATCSFEDGHGLVAEVLGRSLSTKAQGLLLTGNPPSDFDITKCGNAAVVVVPVWLNQKPAAVQCVLFQTGDLQIEYHAGKAIKTSTPSGTVDCTLLFHVYRDETPVEMWDTFDGIAAFLRVLGFNSTSHLRQVWSVSFYERSRKTTHQKGTYLHGFLKVADSKHLELLRLSGLKGFYCSSRSADRGADMRYKVVWLEGLTHDEAYQQLRLTTEHAGLVRAKRGFGVRVENSHYLAVRKRLLPGALDSSDSEAGGDKKFRLLGVPRSTDRSALKRVLVDLGWPAKVIRAQGFQCWLVSSATGPPSRSFVLDDAQVVVTPEAVKPNPVVGGDRELVSKPFHVTGSESSRGPVLPAGAPMLQTVIDETTQAKFQAIEKRLESVEKENVKAQKTVQLRLDGVEARVADIGGTLSSLTGTVEKQMMAGMEQFHKSLEGRFREMNAQNIEAQKKAGQDRWSQFKELQEMLAHKSPKVRAVSPVSRP